MIDSKSKYKEYIAVEEERYRQNGYKGRVHAVITQCEVGKLFKFSVTLRKDELYTNTSNRNPLHKILALYYRRKHNKLGIKLGIRIPVNTFKKGLMIYHSQGIIVHQDSRCGEFCSLHGMNCIGNNGVGGGKDNTPHIGNFFDLGVGATVIGNIEIADYSTVAAGAVLCKSINNPGEVWGGIPATLIKKDQSQKGLQFSGEATKQRAIHF